MTVYKTCVYIDGFNLYRAIVKRMRKGEICSYPSLKMLCDDKWASFPTQEHARVNINIEKTDLSQIYYFTTIVNMAYGDSQKRDRQERYNNALRGEDVDVILGKYEVKHRRGEMVLDSKRKPIRREKQSDVNLATHFVYDVCNKECNYAVIISNDTDFCGAIRFVRKKYPNVVVDVWTADRISKEMRAVATICHNITLEDFNATKQIANFGFDPNDVVDEMP